MSHCTRAAFLLPAFSLVLLSQRPYSAGGVTSRTGQDVLSKEVLPGFGGTLRQIDNKSLTLETADENTLHFRCSKKTSFFSGQKRIKPSDLKPGDMVTVEGRRAPDGSLDAVNVLLSAKS